MLGSKIVRLIGALAAFGGIATEARALLPRSTVDDYIAAQSPISQAGVLANIGTTGSKSSGAHSGVVIASPSSSSPDYLYTWIRDSALVYKLLIDQFTLGLDTTLQAGITNWISSQAILQQVSNPSGTVSSGGLGEPKFLISEAAFTGGWGRPQRDGPALRAISMITYANYLLAHGGTSTVTSTIWPLVKLDLDYVATYWPNTGFDLWEEVNGNSFFTTAVQHRALRQGAALAATMSDATRHSTYLTQADNVLCYLQGYWSSSSNYVISNINYGSGRSGLDANSILASIHSFDPNAGCEAYTFQPCSDKALANHLAVVNSFRTLSAYTINSGIAAGRGVAIGRYKEDSYYNGNPWYLCTFAAAEQLYDALYTWNKISSLSVTSTSLAFFQQFSSSVAVGTYASTTTTYATLTAGVKQMADDFLLINKQYTPSNGGLAEQFNKATGAPTSAADLTWSYAASLSAFQRRASTVPATWGAAGLAPSSSTSCGSSASTTSSSAASTTTTPAAGTVAVTFRVYAVTTYGQNIYVTGSVSQLGNWANPATLLLSSSTYPYWTLTVNLPASTAIQYKYQRIINGVVTWGADPNHSFTTPASGSYTINDTWS